MSENPLFRPHALDGLRIVEDPYMVETVEDWSHVRSPSRASRRRRQGHRQRIRLLIRPKQQVISGMGRLIMHPEVAARLRAASVPLP